MRRLGALVALLLIAAPLTGCLSGDDGGSGRELEQQASAGDRTGGIQGVVTDPAIQPITGANVTLVGPNRTVQVASDGSYAFSDVEPGTHTLRFSAPGFVAVEREATVVAGQVATLDVVLANKELQEAFTQKLEMRGFIECGVGWRQDLASAPTALLEDSALAACAVPNLALPGGNATNDRFLHRFELEPPLTEVVYELAWDAGGSDVTAPPLRTIMELQGHINENGSRIMDVRGPSPIHVQLEPDDWTDLRVNASDRCQGLNGTEQDDSWCMTVEDEGWPMVLRVFATADCLETPVATCLVVQQEFTHYVSAFYNSEAPSGYAITEAR